MKVILVMVWVGFADLECGFGCVFIFYYYYYFFFLTQVVGLTYGC